MSLISVLDSYYMFVSGQMTRLNATVTINGSLVPQPMGGVINARDWPQTKPLEGCLYLLFLSASRNGLQSKSQSGYEFSCQWVWILLGTDILASQQGQSRTDRYRASVQIMDNLHQANYPGFCRKLLYSADGNGNLSTIPAADPVQFSPIEMVSWTEPVFMPKSDNEKSGLVYGAAKVEVSAYDDVSALIV